MKKNILLMAVLCCTMVASAQVSVYVKAGLGFGTFSGGENVDISSIVGGKASLGHDFKLAWKAGLSLECPFNRTFAIVPGVYYWSTGTKLEEYSLYLNRYNNFKITGVANLNYIQVPLNLQLKTSISENAKIAIYVGPYIAVGVGGKTGMTLRGTVNGEYVNTTSELNSFGNTTVGSQRVEGYESADIGLNYGIYIELSHFLIGANVDMGLKETSEAEKNKNLGAEVMIGYRF